MRSHQGSLYLQPLQAKARYQVRVLRPQLTSRILVSKTPQLPLASAIRSSDQAKINSNIQNSIVTRLLSVLAATRNQTRCGTSEESEHIANAKVVRPKRRLARKTRLHRRGCPGPGRRKRRSLGAVFAGETALTANRATKRVHCERHPHNIDLVPCRCSDVEISKQTTITAARTR